MSANGLPADPLAPAEFCERFLPAWFTSVWRDGVPDAPPLALGLALRGDGGGEWCCRLQSGRLEVAAGGRDSADVTVVQSVEDWRGALWGGRGGAFGRALARAFAPSSAPALRAARLVPAGSAASLRAIDALVRISIVGEAAGDWSVDLRVGPGPIPEEPRAMLAIDVEDAAALARRELDPVSAVLSGRIEVRGDVALLLRLQAAGAELVARPTR
ncbi:MAG: SCP2 sterol-binding domain-containing protein [Myxococcota bacterium]